MKLVYILKTVSVNHKEETTLAVYKKSSYQTAYNRLADIAERHGTRTYAGSGNVATVVENTSGTQRWWLERWEVE